MADSAHGIDTMTIPITRPWFTDSESAAVAQVLAAGWVSQGPKVAEFEAAFARYTGAQHAVAVTSCTAALHMILVALGIQPGDEVLVPAFTFVATANAVEYCGARPVFVDIDPMTYNVDVGTLETKITSRTRAIIPVHLFGLSADMTPIMELATRRGLHVIEDAACAIGTRLEGRHVGTFGPAGCFSLHPRKIITTGEGGMITTDDRALAARLHSLRSHAASVSDLARHDGGGFLLPAFAEVGFNYRMTDVQAAIGLAQLAKLDEILRRRIALAEAYTEALRGIAWLRVPQVPAGWVHPFQSYVVWVLENAPLARDAIAERLWASGIATRQGTHAVHVLEYYRKKYGLDPETCRAAWQADQRSLALPLYPTMENQDLAQVVDRLKAVA